MSSPDRPHQEAGDCGCVQDPRPDTTISAVLQINLLLERIAMASAFIDALAAQREEDTDELFRLALPAHDERHERADDGRQRATRRPAARSRSERRRRCDDPAR